MKTGKNKAVVVLITAALLLSALLPAGCSLPKGKKDIWNVAQEFFDAYASGDADAVKAMVDGDITCDFDKSDKEEILLKMASETKVEDVTDVDVDSKSGKATAKVTISYINVNSFLSSKGNEKTKEDFIKAIEEYDRRKTKAFSFDFVFDESEGKWLVGKKSAEKYIELFNKTERIYLSSVSADDAYDIFSKAFGLYAQGIFDQPVSSLDINDVRVFDNDSFSDPIVIEGAKEFAKAFFKYIVDHGIKIEQDSKDPHKATLKGFAPSKKEMLDYLSSDDCVKADYLVRIRLTSVSRRDVQGETLRSTIDAGYYTELAKRIPDMTPEEYEVELMIATGTIIDTGENFDTLVFISNGGKALSVSSQELEDAFDYTSEQVFRCREELLKSLLASGEMPKEKYDVYMAALERDRYVESGGSVPEYEFLRRVEWEGTETCRNQSSTVEEYLPNFSDGQIVYGFSDYDNDGKHMEYSKEPGWLNTAGYNIDGDKVTIILKFDHKFKKGTKLILDWYIDGESIRDSQTITVEEDGTVEFEFTVTGVSVKKYGKLELRLWEEDHNHVISYVQLFY